MDAVAAAVAAAVDCEAHEISLSLPGMETSRESIPVSSFRPNHQRDTVPEIVAFMRAAVGVYHNIITRLYMAQKHN